MSGVKSLSPDPVLFPETVANELMTANPLSIHENLSSREARTFFVDKAISGAPVINAAGRPVGVLTLTDLLIHEREESPPLAFDAPVRDLMTPGVFSVGQHAPLGRVIGDMCELNVHRLFVVDATGVLIGVISAMDVSRHLRTSVTGWSTERRP